MAEYICREDVLKKAKSSISVPADNEWDCGYNTAMAEMQEFIKHLTAADVQPVRHGRWSECYTDTHHYSGICTVCGRASIKTLTESLYEYCPKCGARMDGDTE